MALNIYILRFSDKDISLSITLIARGEQQLPSERLHPSSEVFDQIFLGCVASPLINHSLLGEDDKNNFHPAGALV